MEVIKIDYKDEIYPKRLLEIPDYPKTLYAVGDVSLLNKKEILGIVGSRNCSEYGRRIAKTFADELSKDNICIISGLAIGIDAAAHIGSMEKKRKNNCCIRRWI